MDCRASANSGLPHHRVCMECAWSVKCEDGIPKALLRRAGKGKVPDEVLWRKKSPYPKTYNPQYEALLADRLREEVLQDTSAPIRAFLDRKKAERFLNSPKDYGKPWYGQLMAGPQMIAYVLQINYWMKNTRSRSNCKENKDCNGGKTEYNKCK